MICCAFSPSKVLASLLITHLAQVGDRTKLIVDPLAILINEVGTMPSCPLTTCSNIHLVPHNKTVGARCVGDLEPPAKTSSAGSENQSNASGDSVISRIRIPTGAVRKWIEVDPDLAMFYHAR